jgi:hypothetical protein
VGVDAGLHISAQLRQYLPSYGEVGGQFIVLIIGDISYFIRGSAYGKIHNVTPIPNATFVPLNGHVPSIVNGACVSPVVAGYQYGVFEVSGRVGLGAC